MTSNLDIYNAYHDMAYANPPQSVIEANEEYLADDFQSLGADGSVQFDKESYMGLTRLLFSTFDDFTLEIAEVREEGDVIKLRSHFEGRHTSDLDLSAMGLGVIPASGTNIVWPEVGTTWRFKGGKIASIQNDEGGGMVDFLEPLGMTPQ